MAKQKRSTAVRNRTAAREFATDDDLVAGVVLSGSEVKAVRAGQLDLSGAYVRIRRSSAGNVEAWAVGLTIGTDSHVECKLLLTRDQLSRIIGLSEQQHATVVVTRGFFSRGFFKLEVAVGKRRKTHDRRALLRSRDLERQAARDLAR